MAENDGPTLFKPGDAFRHYPYVIERFIGAGAHGQVYGVVHRHTGDHRVLKAVQAVGSGSDKTIAQRLAEATAVYRIHHHNIVQVFELALEPDRLVWQIMELLDGCSIEELLTRHARFTPVFAIDVAVEIAFGLHEVHEHQIIHRDIHPGNVFVTKNGTVKILDFSLAKVLLAGIKTTNDQRIRGTAHFMSPGQLQGAPPTPQFDVHALGVLLWLMLVGRLPFEGAANGVALLDRQLREDPESLVTAARLPAYFDDVIRRATARDPAMWFDGMWSFVQALRDLRARVLADPAAAVLREPAPWERHHPIAPNPEGHAFYRAPRSLPRDSPEPHLPSARIVVSPAARGPVAPTIPMAARVPAPVSFPQGPVSAAAPTVRARPPPGRRAAWALLVIACGLAALGAALWVVLTWDASAAPAPPRAAPSATARPPAKR